MIDDAGHIIHIDYGFIMGISPGNNLGFETASFKLTGEMVALMGGINSDLYHSFIAMTVRGFLAARNVMQPIVTVVASFADSGLPCFMYRNTNLASLRKRFVPHFSDAEAARHMVGIIAQSRAALTTTLYDAVQKAQNNIFSDVWQ